MNYENIGKFIKERRILLELTQKDLAKKLNITDKAISKWERGLSLPDISLLEPLSKELNVTVTEILRGSSFDEEIVNVSELDNYIIESINYGKSSFKNIINKSIAFIIIFIIILLLLFNIANISKQRIKKRYDLISSNHPLIYKENIIKNINLIKNDQGRYSNDDYKKIVESLTNIEENVKNIVILSASNYTSFTINDLYVIDKSDMLPNQLIRLYRILLKYDSSLTKYNEFIEDYFYTRAYKTYNNFSDSYKYELSIVPLEAYFNNNSKVLIERYFSIRTSLHFYDTLIEKIVEVGDIDE